MSGSGKTNCHWAVLLRYWLCLQGIILYCNPRLQLQKCICSRLLTKHLLLLINAILVSDIKSFFDLTVICLCLYVYLLFLQINICTFFLSSSSTLSCFLSLSKPTPSRWTSTRPSLDITLLFFQENRLTLNSVQFLWRLFMTSRCWTTRHL